MKSKRKLFVLGVAVCLAILVAALGLLNRRDPPPLEFNMVSSTNGSQGVTRAIEVINWSSRTQSYVYWASVQTSNGWTTATNWERHHSLRLHGIAGLHTNRFTVTAPEGVSAWRFNLMTVPQPGALDRQWYALVKRTGLRRLGFRDSAPENSQQTDDILE
jgi:hypothetical protein